VAGSQRPTGRASTRGAGSAGGKGTSRPPGRASRTRTPAGGPDRAAGRGRRLLRLSVSLGTRRAAVLAVVVCALALALAVPLRTYVSQRQELASTAATQAQLTGEVARLQGQKDQLGDPAYVEAQARGRLGYVRPGETPYRVQLPDGVDPSTGAQQQASTATAPWYSELWASVSGGGG
jgi:cell division protein FtsB